MSGTWMRDSYCLGGTLKYEYIYAVTQKKKMLFFFLPALFSLLKLQKRTHSVHYAASQLSPRIFHLPSPKGTIYVK